MRWIRCFVMAALASVANAQQGTATRELTPDEQVSHVLSRLTFGARPGDAERVRKMGADAWVLEQLRPANINDGAVREALGSLRAWTLSLSELADPRPQYAFSTVEPRRPALVDSTLTLIRGERGALMVSYSVTILRDNNSFATGKFVVGQTSERQLLEVISDFWENHFYVYAAKMPSREAIVALYRDAIRPRSFTTFRELLGAAARSPAMLYYLDNHLSTKDGLNENYARELLELHTLGVDGGYTQDDVIAVARALTGWGINTPNLGAAATGQTKFAFHADRHDTATKFVLGHTLTAGRGIEDGEQVLDILARHPSTARFISWKLARRLVSDDPPPAVVERAAATFLRTDGNIAAVVHSIVTSDEFFSRAAFRAKVKSPFEFVLSVKRALGLPPDSSARMAQLLSQFGQAAFGRAEPDGWPDEAASWMNSGAMLKRVMLAADIANGEPPFDEPFRWPGWSRLANESAEHQANAVIRQILGGVATAATRDALLEAPGSGADRLRGMVALALGSPEFQRR